MRVHDTLRRTLPIALLTLGLAPAAPAWAADIHALVVGIDKYAQGRNLEGAVNDADAIANAMRGLGAKVTLLRNGEASRDAILGGWNRIIETARPGDTLVFTYAGHGQQQPERVKGSEKKGKDQLLQLGGYIDKEGNPGQRERILDDEIYDLILKASTRKLRVILVIDSCHSGNMYRSLSPEAGVNFRYGGEGQPSANDPWNGKTLPPEGPLPENVFFYSASQPDEKVPEIPHNGKQHGALSVAFVEALTGGAAKKGDSPFITHEELTLYLRTRVSNFGAQIQNPDVEPRSQYDSPVLPVVTRAAGTVPQPDQRPEVTLRVTGVAAEKLRPVLAGTPGLRIAGEGRADLIWDAARREAVDGRGHVAATNIGEAGLPGLIQKHQALTWLNQQPVTPPLDFQITPARGEHHRGDEVRFSIGGVDGLSLVVFNLAGDGTVQPVWHGSVPGGTGPQGRFDLGPSPVTPPFGADNVIIVAGRGDPGPLMTRLAELDGKAEPWAALRAATAWLKTVKDGRIGQQVIVSREGKAP